MNGKYRGNGKMIDLADRLFSNKKWSLGIVLGTAAVSYLLGLICGEQFLEQGAAYNAPIIGLISFGGVCLVMGLQLINPFSTPKAVDFFEAFSGVFFGGFFAVWYITTGFWSLFGEMAANTVTAVFSMSGVWCGLCVIHHKRI